MLTTPSVLTEVAARAAAQLDDADVYIDRLATHGKLALEHLTSLYGGCDDSIRSLLDIFDTTIEAAGCRSDALRLRDAQREADPRWYQRHDLIGAWAYVDRFSGTLSGLLDRIPYLEELGVGYLHLMPLFARPADANDGGYAVSDYRRIHPPLGSMADLDKVVSSLHDRNISLAVDFVFNHTANDHAWANAARGGSDRDRDCYLTFATIDETMAYQPWLRSIFPDENPGSFIYEPTMEQWVWSTFHDYQWDLNYRSPELFRRMLGEMLFLANRGIDVLRLDAVPFIWKEPGTTCEGLSQAHTIIRAFNALVRIAAPAMIFKSEAIVHPDEVRSYLGNDMPAGRECEIAYNPVLMVEVWEALATEHTHLLRTSVGMRLAIPHRTAWVNYVRSHDDIGWGFADEDASSLGIDPGGHRDFLNRWYTGDEADSTARGVLFQVNSDTGDARLSGTTASLAGLEVAMLQADEDAIEMAIRRIVLIHGIAIASPGMPLLNLGDELGTLNDPSYLYDKALADDNRWVHRAAFDWVRAERRYIPATIEHRIHSRIGKMLRLRTTIPALAGGQQYEPLDLGNDQVYAAVVGADALTVVASFTATSQTVTLGGKYTDLLSDEVVVVECGLDPYQIRWLVS